MSGKKQESTMEEPAASEKSIPKKEKTKGLNRRKFLALGVGAIGTGLTLAIGYQNRFTILFKLQNYMANRNFDPGAFLHIPSSGKIQLINHRSEMGQGIRSTIPMLIAEELNVSWDQINVVQAMGDPKYGSQNTDGSRSIRDFYFRLRKAGAAAREMLIQAAAKRWKVSPQECRAEKGFVIHIRSKRKASYGELSQDASKESMPSDPVLKSSKDFVMIGKHSYQVDTKDTVQGTSVFGIDIDLPDMLYAAGIRSPVVGGKIKSIDSADAKKIRGVKTILQIPALSAPVNTNAAVCVLATNTWAALQGKQALKIEWDIEGCQLVDSKSYMETLKKSLQGGCTRYRREGNTKDAEKKAKQVMVAEYTTPFLVHAPMEPLVCTAFVKGKTCEVWAPCQDPIRAKKAIASYLKIDEKDVRFHVTLLGGGFGRKGQPDFILEAVALSKLAGKPVKMQWSREDEIQHGFYHAPSVQRLSAGLSQNGMPTSWHHQSAFPSILSVFLPSQKLPASFEAGMGMTNMPYPIKNILCEVNGSGSPVRVGWWRSVCNMWHAFAVNSFVDELAANTKYDPIAYRKSLLGQPRVFDSGEAYPQDTGRLLAVIDHTQKKFDWDKALPNGHAKGFANHFNFLSYVALALEASLEQGTIKVHRVVATIDCGIAVHPDNVMAQIEGAIIFGLSAAIHGEISLKNGAVEQSNFHDYPVLRLAESPKIETYILNGDLEKPSGVGEPVVPVVAPALAQALFSLTGKRFRDMPFKNYLHT